MSPSTRSPSPYDLALSRLRQLFLGFATPTGELIFGVLASVAQFELSLIRERTLAGLRDAVAKGVTLGRPCGPTPHRTTLWRRAQKQSALQSV